MKLRFALGTFVGVALGAAPLVSACSGSNANVGDDRSNTSEDENGDPTTSRDAGDQPSSNDPGGSAGGAQGGGTNPDPGSGGQVSPPGRGGSANPGTAGAANPGTAGAASAGGANGGGVQCGQNTCAAGEFCCNPSCGICAPKSGSCIEIFCGPDPADVPCGPNVCTGGQECCNPSCGTCVNPGEGCTKQLCAGECTVDADCRVEDDYCGGCNCLPLAAGEAAPLCDTPPVACFAEPCLNQHAACVNGACAAARDQ